jgi:PKD repeat protein
MNIYAFVSVMLFASLLFSTVVVFPVHAQPTTQPWLEVVPSPITETAPESFDVGVYIRGLDAEWELIGVQFLLTYDPTFIEATDVTIGTFMGNTSWAIHGTYSVWRIEEGQVVYGELILPNATSGEWDLPEFPSGEGLIAAVTFKPISYESGASFDISAEALLGQCFLDANTDYIPFADPQNTTVTYDPLDFTYQPPTPFAGEIVAFEATEPSALIGNETLSFNTVYMWNFGDGTQENTTDATVSHIYSKVGTHDVTLTYYFPDMSLTITTTDTITIGIDIQIALGVTVDVGSIHFRGEFAEFNVLTTHIGKAVNATQINAVLYYGGTELSDLSISVQLVGTGLYRIPYSIPADAQAGTYTLLVEANYYGIAGTTLKTFLVSPTLTTTVAKILTIENGVATISTDIQVMKANITAINARLATINGDIATISSTLGTMTTSLSNLNATITSINGNTATISSTLGTMTTSLSNLNATITSINGNTATISTTLGNVQTRLSDTQTTATQTLYVTSILSAIAVILAVIILLVLRKK